MKLINRNTDYAVRALCFMARNRRGEIFSVEELAKRLKAPHPFMRRVLQILDQKGILESYKGRDGGFKLKKNPHDIFLWDLIKIFQGKLKLEKCLLRNGICPDIRNCFLRKRLLKIEKNIIAELKSFTIHSLLK